MVVRETIAAEANAAVAIAAAVEDRTGAKSAAMEHGAATMEAATMKHRTAATVKHRTTAAVKTSAAMEAATTVETSTAATVETSASAATAVSNTVDLGRQAA